jgi:hypothetical protein
MGKQGTPEAYTRLRLEQRRDRQVSRSDFRSRRQGPSRRKEVQEYFAATKYSCHALVWCSE